ncbi:MAG: DUF4446 family protein [Lachnospirales bacterium]
MGNLNSNSIILYALILIVFLLFGIVFVLFVKVNKLEKKISILTHDSEGQDIINLINNYFVDVENIKNNYDSLIELLKLHDIAIKKSFSKAHVHKYNPFDDIGGNLSWVLVVLDMNNDGFLINTIYHPEGTQCYSREVVGGITETALNHEEAACLKVAKGK